MSTRVRCEKISIRFLARPEMKSNFSSKNEHGFVRIEKKVNNSLNQNKTVLYKELTRISKKLTKVNT